MYNDQLITPLAAWRAEGDSDLTLPVGVQKVKQQGWNEHAIAETVRERISSQLNRDAGSVIISRSATGAITFDGLGMLGLHVNTRQAAHLIVQAMEKGVTDIFLPVDEIQPQISVLDPELQDRGIVEVVTVGESNYSGSPYNRKHNIAVGLSRFNGHLIPQGSVFSFNDILGPVNAATGYKPELVILGEKTLPEYGGGLCQVSTTAYRGIWEHGFPINQRRNHSFSVTYYSPQGTDATIYPPHTDMKFTNDGPSDLLIQTHTDGEDAYFIYYGLRDDRSSAVVGPYTWGHVGIPSPRTEYTTELAPGETRKVGSPVPGLKAAWFRVVEKPDAEEDLVEGVYSIYQARPLYTQIGIAAGDQPPEEIIDVEEPAWITTESSPATAQGTTLHNQRRNPRSIRRGF